MFELECNVKLIKLAFSVTFVKNFIQQNRWEETLGRNVTHPVQ